MLTKYLLSATISLSRFASVEEVDSVLNAIVNFFPHDLDLQDIKSFRSGDNIFIQMFQEIVSSSITSSSELVASFKENVWDTTKFYVPIAVTEIAKIQDIVFDSSFSTAQQYRYYKERI